jgi:hypothetical protein
MVTVNQHLFDDKYLIPKFEEIFTRMTGGKFFHTLNVHQAYLHLPADADSALMQTISTGWIGMFFRRHRHPDFNTTTNLSTTVRSSTTASRKEFTSQQKQISIFQNICSLSETRNRCTRIRSTQRHR